MRELKNIGEIDVALSELQDKFDSPVYLRTGLVKAEHGTLQPGESCLLICGDTGNNYILSNSDDFDGSDCGEELRGDYKYSYYLIGGIEYLEFDEYTQVLPTFKEEKRGVKGQGELLHFEKNMEGFEIQELLDFVRVFETPHYLPLKEFKRGRTTITEGILVIDPTTSKSSPLFILFNNTPMSGGIPSEKIIKESGFTNSWCIGSKEDFDVLEFYNDPVPTGNDKPEFSVSEMASDKLMKVLQEMLNQFKTSDKMSVEKAMVSAGVKFVTDALTDVVKKDKVTLVEGLKTSFVQAPTFVIGVPEGMDKLQASYNLLLEYGEEETSRTFNKKFDGYFMNDYVITMNILIKKIFGDIVISKRNTQGGPAANEHDNFTVGWKDGKPVTEKGYYGSVKALIWEDAIIDFYPNGSLMVLAKKKFEHQVNEFLETIEMNLRSFSKVRNTALTTIETKHGLTSTPVQIKDNSKIVLEKDTNLIINQLLIPSLEDKAKQAFLFTGDFGTGKTETAISAGIKAVNDYGRTFIYLHNAEKFGDLIPYIKNYQPCAVFVEDLDQVAGGDRDSLMNDLLNRLDGTELKNVDCTFIFTTNNAKSIHPAMRRPGRIDQIVHFDYSSLESIEKIFGLWVEGIEGAKDLHLPELSKKAFAIHPKLQGAVIAEIAKRAVNHAQKLNKGIITDELFEISIIGMENHIKFMKEEQEVDNSLEKALGVVQRAGLFSAVPSLVKEYGG